jgi:3-deoxy-manno-octulosonate cytidylyltransferase (CMP-KDO synthetase)
MSSLIVIPARYGSTRLPGKPLLPIKGIAMLERVVNKARQASASAGSAVSLLVATDDARIQDFCQAKGYPVVMTDSDLPSGSDRCLAAYSAWGGQADFILNLQGDAPFTPAGYIAAMLQAAQQHRQADIVTPVIPQSWQALDDLRASKAKPGQAFSGTTCVADQSGRAFWFSKVILPALRKEDKLRAASDLSPVLRHVGLYGYRLEALQRFVAAGESHYEALEGLEQLRALEMGLHIQVVQVEAARLSMSGVDTAEDLKQAEALIDRLGDDFDPAFA